MSKTFHLDVSPLDRTRKAGDVIQVGVGAFMDATILGFDYDGNAKLSRPYAYASNVGTTGPTVLLGAEIYEVGPKFLARCQIVSTGRVAT